MYHVDLGQLIQKLRDNVNGVAQDRLLLCEIYSQLINHHDINNSRFHDTLIKFSRPHKDALVHRYERKHDYMVSQSKRNLIHTWDAFQCYIELEKNKNSTDFVLKRDKLGSMHLLIQKGDFNLVLTPDELDKIINTVYQYADMSETLTESQAQQILLDYDNILTFIAALR